jgi:hypothetical protein
MNQPKYLLEGKPYTPSALTNIRETFDRIRQEIENQKPLVATLNPEGFVLSAQWFEIED